MEARARHTALEPARSDHGETRLNPPPRVVCAGAAAIDRKYRLLAALHDGTSNRATPSRAFGGVARNVAENLARLRVATALVSVVGDDEVASALLADATARGIDTSAVHVRAGTVTSEYIAVLDPAGNLTFGLSTIDELELDLDSLKKTVQRAGVDAWFFCDCNLSADTLRDALGIAAASGLRCAVDAVSVAKVQRLPGDLAAFDLLFLNEDEARAYLGTPKDDAQKMAAAILARGSDAVVLTRGALGAVVADAFGSRNLEAPACDVVDVTGAGDALIAGTLSGLQANVPLDRAVATGMQLAARTVESTRSAPADLQAMRTDAIV